MRRRTLLAAGGTALTTLAGGKPARAETIAMQPLSAIIRIDPPTTLPPLAFLGIDGARKTLADFAGRPTVLNFWATWCAPCVAELPELDQLAATAPDLRVVAVSADRGGAAIVEPFLAAHGIAHALVLLDPGLAAANALGAAGFPTTFIIDAKTGLRGRLEGPAHWSGAADTIRHITA